MASAKKGQATEANATPLTVETRRKTTRREESPDAASRLERKRLSDRRSQRAMREKTKQRIAELESALQALLATNVNRELKEKIAENQALKEEVTRLRTRLERIGRLCIADDGTGAAMDGERGRGPSADGKSPRDMGGAPIPVEVPAGNKRRKVSHEQNILASPENTSPSIGNSTHSPEDRNDAENQEETQGTEDNTFEIPEVFAPHDLNPVTEHQEDNLSFADQAFWSTIQFGEDLDAFANPDTTHYTAAQVFDGHQIQEVENAADQHNEHTTSSEGQMSLDFADLSAPPRNTSVRTPSSANTSLSSTYPPQSSNNNAAIHMSPGLRSTWSLGTPKNKGIASILGNNFEQLVRNALEKYKEAPKETLDAVLPAVPCMAPFFSTKGCNSSLSKGLFEQMREGSTWMEPSSFLGAYWCLHSLLRYFLRPYADEIPYIPPYMVPPTLPTNRVLTCWDFLPWPHVRDRMIAEALSPDGSTSELRRYFGAQSTLCWPYSLNEAITFAPPPDIIFGSTGQYAMSECSGCNCSAPQLTDRFKLHLTRAQHWRLKPGSPQILKKYPELNALVI